MIVKLCEGSMSALDKILNEIPLTWSLAATVLCRLKLELETVLVLL